MPPLSNQDFKKAVYTIVQQIPPGYVLSYGLISLLAGRPHNARLVGHMMSGSPPNVPAHRVVNRAGRLVPGWAVQRSLLEKEGVTFTSSGYVRMSQHLWKP